MTPEAEELFERLGISIADAVRMFLFQSLDRQGLPFDVKTSINRRRTLHAYGIASKYADSSRIPLEEDAWSKAAAEKHAVD